MMFGIHHSKFRVAPFVLRPEDFDEPQRCLHCGVRMRWDQRKDLYHCWAGCNFWMTVGERASYIRDLSTGHVVLRVVSFSGGRADVFTCPVAPLPRPCGHRFWGLDGACVHCGWYS